MRCLVTAGPTFEPLDEVRRLTNFSTGRLGTELASVLLDAGHEVVLLRSETATFRCEDSRVHVQDFSTTEDLSTRLAALASEAVGTVFHAAAVSDFRFGEIRRQTADGSWQGVTSGKVESRGEALVAELLPTPKVLKRLREWFPRAILVGWKYEVGSTQEEALNRGRRQIHENQSDYCVVNGPAYGDGFGVVDRSGRIDHQPDRQTLFHHLATLIAPS